MTHIVLDANVSQKLCSVAQPVQLCDPTGRVLGRFVPAPDMSQWEPVGLEVTEEELDLREQSTEWFSTEEILSHLKDLENVPEGGIEP